MPLNAMNCLNAHTADCLLRLLAPARCPYSSTSLRRRLLALEVGHHTSHPPYEVAKGPVSSYMRRRKNFSCDSIVNRSIKAYVHKSYNLE